MARKRHYWLFKSEPSDYSIDDLERDGSTLWDGVRNYQARNLIRDDIKLGDRVLYYHSNAKPPGLVGLAEVCAEAYPDPTQFDPKSKYHDPKSAPDNPRWMVVDIKFLAKFAELIPLQDLKDDPKLDGMLVIKKGQRLSVQPVEAGHYRHLCKQAGVRG